MRTPFDFDRRLPKPPTRLPRMLHRPSPIDAASKPAGARPPPASRHNFSRSLGTATCRRSAPSARRCSAARCVACPHAVVGQSPPVTPDRSLHREPVNSGTAHLPADLTTRPPEDPPSFRPSDLLIFWPSDPSDPPTFRLPTPPTCDLATRRTSCHLPCRVASHVARLTPVLALAAPAAAVAARSSRCSDPHSSALLARRLSRNRRPCWRNVSRETFPSDLPLDGYVDISAAWS